MILMIDNYDSFTYNLFQYLCEMKEEVIVCRNDEITIEKIRKINPLMIVISPGPKSPKEAGISLEVVEKLHKEYPILGVCLGHQTISEYFGASVIKANEPMHGKVREITTTQKGVFENLPKTFSVTRYHSLIVDPKTLPDCLEITATTTNGEIMGIKHKEYLVEGVQFHPEAILTEHGHKMLENFVLTAKQHNKTFGGEKNV